MIFEINRITSCSRTQVIALWAAFNLDWVERCQLHMQQEFKQVVMFGRSEHSFGITPAIYCIWSRGHIWTTPVLVFAPLGNTITSLYRIILNTTAVFERLIKTGENLLLISCFPNNNRYFGIVLKIINLHKNNKHLRKLNYYRSIEF